MARVAQARGRFGNLARAKSDRSWRGFVGSIAQIVKGMPLWKLQTLRRQNVPFLYEKNSGPRITLLPGVAFNLRRFGALIQLLARSSWLEHIRSNPRNAPTVGGATDLELFLFGGARVDLSAARAALQDMQENRCFYCESKVRQDPHVDHFIPWSRYPRDLALDDQPAALQVARWAYGQAEATSAQLWVSLKYTVNANGRCLEILAG